MALGHHGFGVMPWLYVLSTIWLREHNRLCDILSAEYPHWDDERLYQTAKLILTAENIKIIIEEFIQHLSQYKLKLVYDPVLMRDSSHNFQYANRIHLEFQQVYHWHFMVPDAIVIDNNTYTMPELAFSVKTVEKHGIEAFVHAMATQPAGAVSLLFLIYQSDAEIIKLLFFCLYLLANSSQPSSCTITRLQNCSSEESRNENSELQQLPGQIWYSQMQEFLRTYGRQGDCR